MRPLPNLVLIHALTLLDCVDAFWRMNCAPIQVGRIDPLVDPGAVAAHTHLIVGGSNIGVNSTYESLLNSECTSCEIQADKSAYWTPLLYYRYPNGSFLEVPHGGSVVYYLARGPNANNTVPYPKGLKILTGDKGARSFDNVTMTWGNETYPGTQVANRISFVCLPDGPPLPQYPFMFNTTCPNGMRAQIVFQSCWNGIDLYKSDNSHVAYLNDLDNGVCPPGWDIQLPTLFIEVDYAVGQVPDITSDGLYVFSQGDTTGYGFHADFQNGWEEDVLTAAVENCLVPDNFGQVSYCPSIYASDTSGYAYNCPERPAQINETVHGLIGDQLPGCITITYGPEEATAADMECPSSVTPPHIFTTQDSVPRPTSSPVPGQMFGLPNQQYLGCFNDSEGGIRTLNEVSTTNYTVMTVEWCQNFCMQLGYRLSGVEYAQECHCDSLLNPTAVKGSNQCTWNCGGTMTAGSGAQELCGGLECINVFNNTDPDFVAFGDLTNTAGNAQPYAPAAGFGSNYLGCYTDGADGAGRTLTGPDYEAENMTIQYCASLCAEGTGYQYYGLEFATQCWCGNYIANGGTLLTPTSTPNNGTCSMRCQGNEPEICGGPNALSLYNATSFRPPTVDSPIDGYTAQRCLTDPATTGRSLGGQSYSDASGMTQENCVRFCANNDYIYAGVEYGAQCYCGNSIYTADGAVEEDCPISQLMLCSGDQYEYCGGPSLLNLYQINF